MQRIGKSLATSNNNKKAKILIKRFFPQLALADLSDIMGEILVTCLRVDSDMITEEMAKTISRLLNNIVLGLDRVLNKALKTCGPLITPWLTDITRVCFIIGYYLRLRRAIITVVLCKEGKADYLLLGSYCPIALENTLSKILERVIVECMVNTAKKYALLLQSQIGARKNCLTLSVFTLFTSTIKTA